MYKYVPMRVWELALPGSPNQSKTLTASVAVYIFLKMNHIIHRRFFHLWISHTWKVRKFQSMLSAKARPQGTPEFEHGSHAGVLWVKITLVHRSRKCREQVTLFFFFFACMVHSSAVQRSKIDSRITATHSKQIKLEKKTHVGTAFKQQGECRCP